MFKTEEILTKENYTQAATWCNANGAHIEKRDGQYVIVKNAPEPEPAAAERVAALEAQTGLTRAVRELVLAGGSGASDYVKSKAQEIEDLAAPMRQAQEAVAEISPAAETEEDIPDTDTDAAASAKNTEADA